MRVKTILFISLVLPVVNLAGAVAFADTFGSGANQFTVDFVTVGHPGNLNDGRFDNPPMWGGVNYTYRIGTLEISYAQVAQAVAASSGTNYLAKYIVQYNNSFRPNRPAVNISWYEAAAFVNYLNESNGYEKAYNLSYDTGTGIWSMQAWSEALASPCGDPGGAAKNYFRNRYALYFLPGESEWYKAAYFSPSGEDYTNYASGSNDYVPGGWNNIDAGLNHAWDVGGSNLEQNATRDMMGNVAEWCEGSFTGSNGDPAADRVIRGGDYTSYPWSTTGPGGRSTGAVSAEALTTGFRVAAMDTAGGTATITLCGSAVTAQTHQIVIPDNPTVQEIHAAEELRDHLRLMSGQILAIHPDLTADSNKFPLIVGRSALITQYGKTVDFDSLGIEGVRIIADPTCVVLAGNQRGVLYAVYTFLEDYCNCRWFAVDCIKIPDQGNLTINAIDLTYQPPFEYRYTDYLDNGYQPEFLVRNKLNGLYTGEDPEWGGSLTYAGGYVHTFQTLVSPDDYFTAHPEYFALVNDQRICTGQLCLTNPNVLQIVIDKVRQIMRANPDAHIISVSQNDNWGWCTCPQCTALVNSEGSQAGPLLSFVNAVADAVRDERPDLLIDTLAYQYTKTPPLNVRPRSNVLIRLCTDSRCDIHSLNSPCSVNQEFMTLFNQWKTLANHLYIWNYAANFRCQLAPLPNLYALGPDIQLFAANGVAGVFEEGIYFSNDSEMAKLRSYLIAKLLWNPNYNVDQGIEEFTNAYYGAAGPYIKQYLELLRDQICSRYDLHGAIYESPSTYLYNETLLADADALFDQAQAAVAADPTLLLRVRVARLGIQFTELEWARGSNLFCSASDAQLVPVTSARPATLNAFMATVQDDGISQIVADYPGFPSYTDWIKDVSDAVAPLDLVVLQNANLKIKIIPQIGGRIWSVSDVKTGRELMKQSGSPDTGFNPRLDGWEEYSTGDYRSPGWSESYQVLSQGSDFVEMSAGLSNGLTLWRRIELPAGDATVKIYSRLTNSTGLPIAGQLRIHPEFAIQNATLARVRTRTDGGWETIVPADPADPNTEKETTVSASELAGGDWSCYDPGAGWRIWNQFDAAQVDHGLIHSAGLNQYLTLEFFSRPATLNPEESLELDCRYTFQPLADIFGQGPNAFSLNFVTIGNPGNLNDGRFDVPPKWGGVNYNYRICTSEISYAQVAKAIAASVGTGSLAQYIVQFDNSGNPDRPAVGLTWYEAAAYVNYLNEVRGFQKAYNLAYNQGTWSMQVWPSADASPNGDPNASINYYRHKDCMYFLPGESEWYKAAYYKASVTDYTTYANGSNDPPVVGWNNIDTGLGYTWDIAGSLKEQNGTFDMMGNVAEWCEGNFTGSNNTPAADRTIRGGCFTSFPWQTTGPGGRGSGAVTSQTDTVGLRVAARIFPSPGTLGLLPGDANGDGKVDVGDLGILAANYGVTDGATWAQGDFNGDHKVDVGDLGILAANYGAGTGASLDFAGDAEALGLGIGDNSSKVSSGATCGTSGLPLILGVFEMGLTLSAIKKGKE